METVPPSALFSNYPYATGVSRDYAYFLRGAISKASPAGHTRAYDIGANDGTLIDILLYNYATVTGIDPTPKHELVDKGYFPQDCTLDDKSVDLVTSFNVLAHQSDPDAFVKGVKRILRPDGVWVIGIPWLESLLQYEAWDTVYHEHVTYWSFQAIQRLLDRHSMWVEKVEYTPHHGGSLTVYARHGAAVGAQMGEHLVHTPEAYDFCRHAVTSRVDIWWDLYDRHRVNWYGFGAAAKGSVFAAVAGIDHTILRAILDETPDKVGKYTPQGIFIEHPYSVTPSEVGGLLVFPWNFAIELKPKLEFRFPGAVCYTTQGGRV